MQCKYCGAKLSENAKFCGVCGNKVERENRNIMIPYQIKFIIRETKKIQVEKRE